MGVLKIDLGSKGIYVLNKQSPNRQIWWSSPLSGPKRFEWSEAHIANENAKVKAWRNTRDGVLLTDLFNKEFKSLFPAVSHPILK